MRTKLLHILLCAVLLTLNALSYGKNKPRLFSDKNEQVIQEANETYQNFIDEVNELKNTAPDKIYKDTLNKVIAQNDSNGQVRAAIITCTGLIDDGLYSSIKRRANSALEKGANYIILEIETYGGLVKSADDISKFLILDLSKKARTVAYVNTEAISAGAMISVSCQDIIMRKNTTIGDCAPIQMGSGQGMPEVEREKAESFIRAVFERAAQANNYPEPLLVAMVSRHIKVWRVKNLETDKYEFFKDENLPKDANEYDIAGKELIDNENEILTLTAQKAQEYGIARAVVTDVNEAIAFLAKRDNVTFDTRTIRMEPNWSEQLVRMLNNPTVSAILFMVAMLAVYIELKAPGVGLPGLVAVICFAILFGSRYLTGMATWWEMAVFAVGIFLVALEIFVIPGFGIAGVLGIFFILVSIFAILVPNRPDELPWPKYDFNNEQWRILSSGAWAFTLGFVGFIVLAYILSKYLPKKAFFAGLMLAPAGAGFKVNAQTTVQPGKESPLQVGAVGTAITILRPAGKAKFGEAMADVVAEGDYIQKDKSVKIVLIQGYRVVVREVSETI
jgi:membrane-bound serine protease (ClpP class)